MEERLQKVLARAGLASRRKAEEMISAGRVDINGRKVTELGTKVDARKDLIRVDGKLIEEAQSEVYLVLYKPAGVVTTLSDPEGRPTVASLLKGVAERVYPIGRLDYDAEGALLLTNDGDLAHKLMHPKFGARRTYLAKVRGRPDDGVLDKLRAGIRLEDGMARPLEVKTQSHAERNTWIRIVVDEGRPHLIKRLFLAVEHPVQRLYRPDYAGVSVEGMEPGHYRELSQVEVKLLKGGGADKAGFIGLPARRHGRGPGGSAASLGAHKRRTTGAPRGAGRSKPEHTSEAPRGPSRGKPEHTSEAPRGPSRGKPERGAEAPRSPSRGRPERGAETSRSPSRGRPERGAEAPRSPSRGRPERGAGPSHGAGRSKPRSGAGASHGAGRSKPRSGAGRGGAGRRK